MIKISFKNKKRMVNFKCVFRKLLHNNLWGKGPRINWEVQKFLFFFFLFFKVTILLKDFEEIIKLLKHDQVIQDSSFS